MSSAKQIVEDAIANNKVVVFAKSYCHMYYHVQLLIATYCKKAKTLLDSLNVKYESIDLDLHPEGEAIQAYLHDKTGQNTVPNIFIHQKHVGGSDVLAKLAVSGKLKELLAGNDPTDFRNKLNNDDEAGVC